jgi:hypothetical protein
MVCRSFIVTLGRTGAAGCWCGRRGARRLAGLSSCIRLTTTYAPRICLRWPGLGRAPGCTTHAHSASVRMSTPHGPGSGPPPCTYTRTQMHTYTRSLTHSLALSLSPVRVRVLTPYVARRCRRQRMGWPSWRSSPTCTSPVCALARCADGARVPLRLPVPRHVHSRLPVCAWV